MDYNLYHEDMLTIHYRIIDYNLFLGNKVAKSSFIGWVDVNMVNMVDIAGRLHLALLMQPFLP